MRKVQIDVEGSMGPTTYRRGSVLNSRKVAMIPAACKVWNSSMYMYLCVPDGLNGLFLVWWPLKEDLVVVLLLVRVRALELDIWMIRYGSSFHHSLLAIFFSRLL